MARIYVSAGHGGRDPGAVSRGRQEKVFNLALANRVSQILREYTHTVFQNRTTDVASTIDNKVKQANDLGVDFFLELHFNAGGGTGTEAFHSYLGGKGKDVAEIIVSEIAKLGYRNRGTKIKKNASGNDYFGVIRRTKAPVTLVEYCFIDNDADMAKYDLEKAAQAIVKGVVGVFGGKKPTPTPTPAPTPTPSQPKIGSVVDFKGGSHYATSQTGTASGSSRRAGKATVTNYRAGARNPYHLVAVKGGTSNVFGWVPASAVGGATVAPAPAPTPAKPKEIKKGDTVKFKGGKHYTTATGDKSVGGNRTAGDAKVTIVQKGAKNPYHLVGIGKCNVYGWVKENQIG